MVASTDRKLKAHEVSMLEAFGDVGRVEPAASSLTSREGIIDGLKKIYEEADKPVDKIRALDKIADLRGLKSLGDHKNLRRLPPEELEGLVDDVVLPALKAFGVRKARSAGDG